MGGGLMPIISAELVHAGGRPAAAELEQQLLSGQTLLSESADHMIEVVDVLKSYGEVLDAYSINLIFKPSSSSYCLSHCSNTLTVTKTQPRSGAT